jgi:hypothetical protein
MQTGEAVVILQLMRCLGAKTPALVTASPGRYAVSLPRNLTPPGIASHICRVVRTRF